MGDFLVSGIVVGSIITLGAIGVTLVASILNLFNFAHGSLFTLGAYFTLSFLNLLPNWGTFHPLSFGPAMVLAAFLSMAATAVVALLFDRLLLRPLRLRGATSLFLALSTLGLAFILRAAINLIWGPEVKYYTLTIQKARNLPLGISITPDELFIIITTLVLVLLLQLFLRRTKMGKAMRAMADSAALARVCGIGTDRVIIWTWIIAGALAAVAGTLYGIKVQLRPLIGWNLLIPLFAAVIVGGIGSFRGALAGGMIIGIAQEVIVGATQDLFIKLHINALMSVYKQAVVFMLLIIVLLLRPRGIWGRR